MINNIESIKILRKYEHPANFFIDRIPEYVKKSGDEYICVQRAFNEIMGMTAGVHAAKYRERIWNIHMMSLVAALKKLEKMGLVKRWGPGVWKWIGNNGGKHGY